MFADERIPAWLLFGVVQGFSVVVKNLQAGDAQYVPIYT